MTATTSLRAEHERILSVTDRRPVIPREPDRTETGAYARRLSVLGKTLL